MGTCKETNSAVSVMTFDLSQAMGRWFVSVQKETNYSSIKFLLKSNFSFPSVLSCALSYYCQWNVVITNVLLGGGGWAWKPFEECWWALDYKIPAEMSKLLSPPPRAERSISSWGYFMSMLCFKRFQRGFARVRVTVDLQHIPLVS